MTFIEVIKPTVFKVLIFIIIGYWIVPVFAQPSSCLDLLADNPYDAILPRLPCVKLTTIPEHIQPLYIKKNAIVYQQNATYSMDVSMRFGSPLLNLLFSYCISCGIVYSATWLWNYRKVLRSE